MKKKIIGIGAAAMAISMAFTPMANVYASEAISPVVTIAESTEQLEETDEKEDIYTVIDAEVTAEDTDSDGDASVCGILGTKYIVTASSLNVRSGPGTDYSIIGTISKGQTVTVKSISEGWAKIKFNGSTGYVSATYLKLA